MKRRWFVSIAVAAVILVPAAPFAPGGLAAAPDRPDPAVQSLADGNNAFALDLYAQLKGESGNLFFSPWSIRTALAMAWTGAAGRTAEQMGRVLHCGLPPEEMGPILTGFNAGLMTAAGRQGVDLTLANSLWVQRDFHLLPVFVENLQANYGAGVHPVDFVAATEDARQAINDWAGRETHGLIPELLDSGVLDDLTRLVLANAVHFMGGWSSPFDSSMTVESPFLRQGKSAVRVPLMHKQARYGYVETSRLQALEIPYAWKGLSMVIVLPRRVDGLPDVEKSLSARSLRNWTASVESEVDVYLPTFKSSGTFDLNSVLVSMGMPDAFHLPPADFSGMTGRRDLYISNVIHKAFVDVGEKGTEAAAATAVVMQRAGITHGPENPPPVFRADHPFIFLIRDTRSGAILFMGRVLDPTA